MFSWKNKFLAKYRTVLFIFIGTLAIVVLLNLTHNTPQTQAENTLSRGIEVILAKTGTFTPQIILYGRIESPHISQLSAAIKADVLAVHVKEGEIVQSSQWLLELDPKEVILVKAERQAKMDELSALIETEKQNHTNDQAALVHEQKLIELLRKSLSRYKKLESKRLGSAQRRDEAEQDLSQQMLKLTARKRSINTHKHRLKQLQAQLSSAKAQWQQAELDVTRTHIQAPFHGRIVKVNVSAGDRVQVGTQLLSLVHLNSLEVRSQIPANYLAQIKRIMKQAPKDSRISGYSDVDNHRILVNFHRLASEVRLGQGGIDAIFSINSAHTEQLTLGRTLRISVNLPPISNVIALPEQALYPNDQIYLYDNHYARAQHVQLLGSTQTDKHHRYVLISSKGFKSNQEIIVTRIPNLTAKTRLHKVNTLSNVNEAH